MEQRVDVEGELKIDLVHHGLAAELVRRVLEHVAKQVEADARDEAALLPAEHVARAASSMPSAARSLMRPNRPRSVHLHVLALDGVYVRDAERGTLRFEAPDAPSQADVLEVARRTAERIDELLRASGRSLAPEGDDTVPDLVREEPGLAACYAAAAQGLGVSGERTGQRERLRVRDSALLRGGLEFPAMTHSARAGAKLADFWAIPESERFHELIDGELTEKAVPSAEHGSAQVGVVLAIGPRYQRRSGSGEPGGWWLLTEVEILLAGEEVVRPDVVGYRRERCPERPKGTPIELRPDWICEIISPSNSNHDTIRKLRLYHRVALPHYWLLDPRDSTLTVLRFSTDGYVTVTRAAYDEVVRAEPFDAIEIAVATLFGDDAPEQT